MKKFTLFAYCIVQTAAIYANNSTSHTFFSVRPQWRSDAPEKISFFHNNLFVDNHTLFEVSVFGGKSTNSSSLARYFLPFNSCNLRVAEVHFDIDGQAFLTPEQKNENLIAQNINIVTQNGNFFSILSFAPQQTVFGIGLDFKQRLGKRWWLEISAPIERIHNTMGMSEKIINDGGGVKLDTLGLDNSPVVANGVEAFRQASWKYGKIVDCKEKWGLADIEAKIGLLFINKETHRFNGYAGILIPTGNKPKGKVVFEEIIGNNKHFGIMVGDNIGFSYLTKHDFALSVEFDGNYTYLFKNHQVRSFDPVDKSFGRYLSVYSSRAQAALALADGLNDSGNSGINFFTGTVAVRPRGSADINIACIAEKSGYATECGWNIYARQEEKVCLQQKFPTEISVKELFGDGRSNPTRGINTIVRNEDGAYPAGYSPLTSQDLNMNSASHPAFVSNTFYASLGYKDDCGFINTGGSYEHNASNSSLNRWLVWAKAGLTF